MKKRCVVCGEWFETRGRAVTCGKVCSRERELKRKRERYAEVGRDPVLLKKRRDYERERSAKRRMRVEYRIAERLREKERRRCPKNISRLKYQNRKRYMKRKNNPDYKEAQRRYQRKRMADEEYRVRQAQYKRMLRDKEREQKVLARNRAFISAILSQTKGDQNEQ
jgi:hypothetical protein